MIYRYIKFATLLLVILYRLPGLAQEAASIDSITYEPVDQELFDTIVAMDKAYFDAYNTCDMKEQALLYDEDLEFYHDKGGLMTSKQDVLDAIEKNICGKVKRTLLAGSVEVYPIKDFGAVEIGYHKFFNKEEPNAPSKPSKFIILWKQTAENWVITKVISLH